MDRKFTELSTESQAEAKRMYLEHFSIAEIARQFDVSRQSMSYHANKYWKSEKDLLRAELFQQFTENKRTAFTRMSQAAIDVMTRALEEQARRIEAPSIREAKDAVAILEALDKITRLDDGNPTEILAEKPLSITSLKAKLALDPFNTMEIEDADFSEDEGESKVISIARSDTNESDSDGQREGHLSKSDT